MEFDHCVANLRRTLLFFLLTIVSSGVPFGVVLWIIWTHDLHYNVYSDGEFWYREYFPKYFNLIVTTLFSFCFGLVVALIIWTVRHRAARTTD